MNREIIPFTTEEAWLENRKKDLTSTDIADLFGCGYSNYEELFNRKLKGLDSTFVPNERSNWGKALEPAIATEFARINNWNIHKKSEYIRIPELRLGSSFDYSIYQEERISKDIKLVPGMIYQIEYKKEIALMEIKNVGVDAYKRDWNKGFTIEAPAKIEFQIQNELLVSGLSKCYLCVLVGGNQGIPLVREANPKIQQAIITKAAEFWRRIDQTKST